MAALSWLAASSSDKTAPGVRAIAESGPRAMLREAAGNACGTDQVTCRPPACVVPSSSFVDKAAADSGRNRIIAGKDRLLPQLPQMRCTLWQEIKSGPASEREGLRAASRADRERSSPPEGPAAGAVSWVTTFKHAACRAGAASATRHSFAVAFRGELVMRRSWVSRFGNSCRLDRVPGPGGAVFAVPPQSRHRHRAAARGRPVFPTP